MPTRAQAEETTHTRDTQRDHRKRRCMAQAVRLLGRGTGPRIESAPVTVKPDKITLLYQTKAAPCELGGVHLPPSCRRTGLPAVAYPATHTVPLSTISGTLRGLDWRPMPAATRCPDCTARRPLGGRVGAAGGESPPAINNSPKGLHNASIFPYLATVKAVS